jgi:hypothetical protein
MMFQKHCGLKLKAGGYHRIYRQPNGGQVGNSKASDRPIFGPGIDVRACGGYIVAPGSTIAGRQYQWDNGCPISAAPQWMMDRCKTYKPKNKKTDEPAVEDTETAVEAAKHYIEHVAPEAVEGDGGDLTTFKVACAIKDCRVSKATALELMREWNLTKAIPPWEDSDLRKKVDSAYKNGCRDPNDNAGLDAVEIDENKKPAAVIREQPGAFETTVTNGDKGDKAPIRIAAYARRPLSAAPPRPWLIRGLLCRSQVTALIGPPGVAKSTLMLSGGVALLTGSKDVLGMPVHEQARRVWIYNNEDPEEEMRRRLDGICQEFDISPPEGQLLLSSGAECPLLIAGFVDGKVSRQAVVDELIREIVARNVDVFVADPVAEFHEAPEENIHMKRVLGIFREIAIKTGCAVWIGAHTRKADRTLARIRPGDLEEWRGGSSQGGVVRLGHTLVKANADDAKQYSFEGRFSDYVRLDMAKTNLGRKEEEPRWYRFKSLPVGMDGADDVGVLRPVSLTNAAPDRLAILAREIKAKFGSDRVRVKDVIRGLPSHERILFGTNESQWAREATKAFDGAPEGMTDYGILSHKKTGATSPMTLRLETATTAIQDVAVLENEVASET